MTLDSSSEGGLYNGLSGLVKAAVDIKNAFDPATPSTPANAGLAQRPSAPSSVPWYQRPVVILGAVVAAVIGFLLWRRGK